jgi:hypothetical protein
MKKETTFTYKKRFAMEDRIVFGDDGYDNKRIPDKVHTDVLNLLTSVYTDVSGDDNETVTLLEAEGDVVFDDASLATSIRITSGTHECVFTSWSVARELVLNSTERELIAS